MVRFVLGILFNVMIALAVVPNLEAILDKVSPEATVYIENEVAPWVKEVIIPLAMALA